MKKNSLLLATLLIFAGFCARSQSRAEKYLETVKVTDSIYVFKPRIDWVHGNGIAIIGNDGVFFIDTYIQTNYAEAAIQGLKKITRLPIKYVLNTHHHNDHVLGNSVFKKAFPGCQFIASDSCFRRMNGKAKKDIETEKTDIDESIKVLEKELKDGKMANGTPITGNLVNFWKWQLQETIDYKKQYKGNRLVNADITFSDSLTVRWGSMTLKLGVLKEKGHSVSDVMVWIPEKKLIITGDIVVAPTPYANANTYGMLPALQQVIDYNPQIIIPGHGPVLYDHSYLHLLKQVFTAYITETEKAFQNKMSRKDAVTSISFPELDAKLTGDDLVKKWAYISFFARGMILYTYQALEAKQKAGQ